jgi:hypothetical protein
MLLFAAVWASPPPLDLIGLEKTPRSERNCELLLADHDGEIPFALRLTVSAPDAQLRSWVQRVTLGVPSWELAAQSPVASVYELDVHQNFVDERVSDAEGRTHVTYVRPRTVDWSRWPLAFDFIAPRVDAPGTLGAWSLTTRAGATPADWGSCILVIQGPGGISACAMIAEQSGRCLADYVQRHERGQ